VSLIDLGLDIEQEPSGQIKIAKTGIFATNKPSLPLVERLPGAVLAASSQQIAKTAPPKRSDV
jgi:hypothetical protein